MATAQKKGSNANLFYRKHMTKLEEDAGLLSLLEEEDTARGTTPPWSPSNRDIDIVIFEIITN